MSYQNANIPLNREHWFNAGDINKGEPRIVQPPKIDKEASNILGQEVRVNDPRLIKAVNKMRIERQQKGGDKSNEPDGFVSSEKFKRALKEAFK